MHQLLPLDPIRSTSGGSRLLVSLCDRSFLRPKTRSKTTLQVPARCEGNGRRKLLLLRLSLLSSRRRHEPVAVSRRRAENAEPASSLNLIFPPASSAHPHPHISSRLSTTAFRHFVCFLDEMTVLLLFDT